MGQSRNIFVVGTIYLGFIICVIFLFSIFQAQFLTYVPLVAGILLIGIVPPAVSLGLVLSYVCFDGMLKVLSGYNPVLHVGSDILMIVMTLRFLANLIMGQHEKAELPPFLPLFIAHVAWVAVEIFNPYGGGFLPGIASYKYYLSFLMLYFYAFIFIRRTDEVHSLMWLGIVIMVIEMILATIQFRGGEAALLALSPNYEKIIAVRFTGQYFRPFGTAAMPGGASTFIFLSIPLALAILFLTKNTVNRLLIGAAMIGSGYVLFISQVRSSILKGFAAILFFTILNLWRKPLHLMTTIALVGGIWFFMQAQMSDEAGMAYASRKFSSLTDIDQLKGARGIGFLDRIIYLTQNAPLGIGLSRVGGAGAVFNRDRTDEFFDSSWGFSDNLYLALVIELGVPGCILFLLLIFLPFGKGFYYLIRVPNEYTRIKYTVGACLGLVFGSIIGHYGSEGSLSLPESAYVWLFLGCAMRVMYLNRSAVAIREDRSA